MSYIGPTLPPNFVQNSLEKSSEDEDAYGPALPPHLRDKNGSSSSGSGSAKSDNYLNSKRESVLEARPENQLEDDCSNSESDGEVIGPLPVSSDPGCYSSSAEVERRALNMKNKLLGKDAVDNEPKREDWMIELPELKSKNFGLGPRAFNRTDKPEIKGRDEWTSTPGSNVCQTVEKLQFFRFLPSLVPILMFLVSIFQKGKTSKREAEKDSDDINPYVEHKRNKRLEKIVEAHDKVKRSKSLLESHQESRKQTKVHSPPTTLGTKK